MNNLYKKLIIIIVYKYTLSFFNIYKSIELLQLNTTYLYVKLTNIGKKLRFSVLHNFGLITDSGSICFSMLSILVTSLYYEYILLIQSISL